MKKTIALVISIIMLIFALTACGGSKQSEEPAEETTAAEETTEETAETEDPVAGNTYVMTSTKDGDDYHEMGPNDHPTSFVFGTDNTFQHHGYDENMEDKVTDGTYTVSGNVVTINFAGSDESFDHIISGDTLTYTTEIEGMESTIVYTKVTE